MDEQLENGNVFAVPALWKPLVLAQLDEGATGSNASPFEVLGTSEALKKLIKRDWTLIDHDRSAT